MERFLQQHRDQVIGVLSGLDRIVFRGSLRSLSYRDGLEAFLATHRVLYKDFGRFAQSLSARLKTHAEQLAAAAGRPFQYVASAKVSKENLVRQLLAAQPVAQGLIVVLSCVEPCQSFELRRDRQRRHLALVPALRKCLFLYFYFWDREFGLMHVRLQTWLPFTIQVCLNGREYLARQMDRLGIGYEQRDNCFTRLDDLPRAQKLLDRLHTRRWPGVLNALARRLNPLLRRHSGLNLFGYYWSVRQSEYATDVLFRSPADLRAVYPRLLDHALRHFGSDDVLRFLGRRIQPARFNGEVKTELRRRFEGARLKHWVEENSLKMYDKQGSVLRIETTLNNPRRFRVRRLTTRQGRRCKHWLPLRKGVADMARRVEICRAANERYLEALAVVGRPAPVPDLLDPISRPIVRAGRPYRALRPITADEARLFALLLRGEFRLQGFRNRDLRALLAPRPANPRLRRQASGRVTRLLRLFRAHGLIRKVPHTFYYRVTHRGEQIMTTALRLRTLDLAAVAA